VVRGTKEEKAIERRGKTRDLKTMKNGYSYWAAERQEEEGGEFREKKHSK